MTTNIRINSLLEVSLAEAIRTWNEGFSDYYVSMPLTPHLFASVKYGSEDIDPEHSFIAFADDRPAGFLLNAFRVSNGEKTAWNGGTAVVPEFRRLGVGKALMEKALAAYREQEVGTALLEAFVQNERAISLYRSFGYETVDTLNSFLVEGEEEPAWGDSEQFAKYEIKHVPPRELSLMPFYPKLVCWQTQWRSGRDGEAIVLTDRTNDSVAGYALYRRSFDAQGAHTATSVLQAVSAPERQDEQLILRSALHYVFSVRSESPKLRRAVFAAPSSQASLVGLLENLGLHCKHMLVHMSVKP